MPADADFLLAMKLQNELNGIVDEDDVIPVDDYPTKSKKRDSFSAVKRTTTDREQEDLNATKFLVHPMWESLDPTPDVHSLFGAFNSKFFQSRLHCVELEWSKRMYSCAGICYSRRNGMGMQITIRLSEPLLKLRSRKDLVETLLHEMIHAYCFVLNIREGNGGHGPNFKKIMFGINKVAGTNITVYHTFHDEVDVYKTHWWRCNGLCQNRKPFYGYVKRTSNRVPGPNDFWWNEHQNNCGGTFLKVREPEKAPKKSKGKEKTKELKANNVKPLTNYFPKQNTSSKGPVKMNGGGTMVINPKTTTSKTIPPTKSLANDLSNVMGFKDVSENTPKKNPKSIPGGNLTNVKGFRDMTDEDTPPPRRTTSHDFSGSQGYSMTSNTSNGMTPKDPKSNRDFLRNVWANKFSNTTNTNTPPENKTPSNDTKRRRLSQTHWESVDVNNDVMVAEVHNEIIDLSSDDEGDHNTNSNKWSGDLTQAEKQVKIKQEIINESFTDLKDDDIELIDDDYDDNEALNVSADIGDTSLIDDLFGEDTLMKDFNIPSTSKGGGSNNDVSCPICQSTFHREFLGEHLDGCSGLSLKIEPKRSKNWKAIPTDGDKIKPKVKVPNNARALLLQAGYTDHDVEHALKDTSTEENSSSGETVECPVCFVHVPKNDINSHLDNCLY